MIRHPHRPISSRRQFYLATAAMGAIFAWSSPANALPTGFSVAGPVGGAALDPLNNSTNLTVDQSSNRVVINWSTFNIDAGQTVKFNQPSNSSIAFNVVNANSFTTINGALQANGGVWLFSPAGILFGAGSAVSTGSFLASTGTFKEDAASLNTALNSNSIQIFGQPAPDPGSITVTGASSIGSSTIQAATIDAKNGFVMLNSPSITQDGGVTASDAVVYNADEGVTVQFLPASDSSGISLVNEISAAAPSGKSSITEGQYASTTAGTWFEADVASEVTQPGGGIINLAGQDMASGMKATGNPGDPGNGYSVILDGESTGPTAGTVTSEIVGSAGGCLTGSIDAPHGLFARAGTITTGRWSGDTGAVTLQAANAITIPDNTAVTASGPINIDPNGPVDVEGQINSGTSVFIAATQVILGADGAISAGPGGPQPGTINTTSSTATVTLQNYATNGDTPVAPGTGGGNIMIGAPLSWSIGGEPLTLSAYNSLIVGAPITASDPDAQVSLNTAQGGAGGAYSFVNGGSLSFTGPPNSNQSLYINDNYYTLIFNQAGLLDINNPNNESGGLSGDYALAGPLDFAAGDTATVFTGAPIAPTVYAPFTGTFTGLGNTISNLNIQEVTPVGQILSNGGSQANGIFYTFATNGGLGLFGFVGAGGVLRDVNLSNAQVSGGDGVSAGALVGYLDGTVMNASSSGTITVGDNTFATTGAANGDSAQAFAGGLVGASDGQIVNSHSSATVSATGFLGDATAGGLVGMVANSSDANGDAIPNSGMISNSSATGSVTVGDGDAMAGGLVGYVNGFNGGFQIDITGSSATGAVTGGDTAFLGGFAGEMDGPSVSGSFATGAVKAGASSDVGGFAGIIYAAGITTSYATGAVTQTAAGTDGRPDIAGGFVGYTSYSSITQSYSTGAVNTVGGPDVGADTLAGGFAGEIEHTGSASADYSLGAVTTTTGANADLGGFAGLVQDSSSVSQVYATGLVSGAAGSTTAGLVAVLGASNEGASVSSLSDSYWDTGTTGQGTGYHITPAAMGFSPATATLVNGITGVGVYSAATYGNFDFANTWVLVPGVTRPMLQSEYSTTITNAHQLQLMELHPDADYTLANDIDASGTSAAAGTAGGLWNPATGFSPVGGNGEAAFTGAFNGQGYTISNLSITYTTADLQTPASGVTTDGVVGLFGFVGPAAVLENVNLANAHVTGGDGMLVGALAGGLLGSVNNASSSGVITVGDEAPGGIAAEVGGLIGGSAGSIANSSSSASVTGGNAFAGGLLGSAGGASTITNSFATGTVVVGSYPTGAVDHPVAGGLIGEISNTNGVSGSYATGSVTGGAQSYIGGLIGVLEGGSVTNSYATGPVSGDVASGGAGSIAGGFVGVLSDAIATNDYATGAVTQTAASTTVDNLAGGFVGYAEDNAEITNAYASGAVATVAGTATPGGPFTFAGGFAGALDSGTVVSAAYALGAVTATGGTGNFDGGFTGIIQGASSADQVYATGHVSSPGTAAGLVGMLGNTGQSVVPVTGFLSNSYWDQGTTGQANGYNQNGSGTPVNVLAVGVGSGHSAYDPASYSNFDFTGTWFMVDGSTRPILQSEYSTTVTNAHQLQLMDMDPNASYTLANNIDASGTSAAAGAAGGLWNPATGFSPVGASVATPFTGLFDGQGHTISNLTIIDTTQHTQSLPSEQQTDGAVGLFGFATGTLQNVNLANVNVTGGDGMEVGALVGDLAGTVVNASSSGHVTVGNFDNEGASDARGGGLIGELDGGAVENSSSSATVTGGAGALVGGLIGEAEGGSGGATATGSFATGNVIGGAGSTAGGFIGFGSNFTASYSYATGSVTQSASANDGIADNWAGGFAGDLEFSTVNSSFATGAVSSVGTTNNPALAGGFVGNLLDTAVTNAYATGSVTVTGPDDIAGGFAGTVGALSDVTSVYAIGAVDPNGPGATKGGLFGTVSSAGQPDLMSGGAPTIMNAYWNSTTTGQAVPYTLIGSATITSVANINSDPYTAEAYQNFNFGGGEGTPPAWSIPSAGFYPQLYGASHVLNVTAEDSSTIYGNYPVYTLSVTGLQGGDTIASAVHGFVVQPLDPQDSGLPPSVGLSGYYNVNNNQNDPYNINDPYDLSIAQTIVASGQTGAYQVIYNDNSYIFDGALTVNPAQLNVAAVYDERPYDGGTDSSQTPEANGIVPGDFVSDQVTGGAPTQSFDGSDAGGHTLTVNPFTVNDNNNGANYTTTTTAADGQIDPEDILIGAVSDTKVYDGTTYSGQTPTIVSGQLYGEDAGDTVSGTQAFESKDVLGTNLSTLVVTQYTLDLTDPGNYNIIGTTATAPGTITPAPLQIDATFDSKVYDGTTVSTATPTVDDSTQVFEGDSVTGLTQAFASKDVLGANNSVLNVTGYTVNDGNGGNDYTVTTVSAEGTITPASITLSATPDLKVYDGTTNSGQTPTASQLFSTDSLVATQSYTSKDVLGTNQSTLAINPGYSINDGNGGADYTITNVYTAPGTITPASITLSATPDLKVYDGTTNSGQTPTASQLFSTDTLVATQSYTSKDVLGTNQSTLAINEGYSINDGNGGADYTITNVYTAPGTITPAPLQIDATFDSKVYDGTTVSTATPTVDDSTQVFGNDSVTGLTQAFASKDVLGANNSVLNVTGYTVNDGNGGNDYTVTVAPAAGTITPAALQIDATFDSKVYDGTTVSTATPTVDDSTQVFGNDSVTGLTQAFASKDVLGANNSVLNVTGYTVNDGNGGNDYTVTTVSAEGTITPASITLSATPDLKVYDGTTNSGQTPTASQLFSTDSLVATQSYTSKDVLGTNQSTLAINPGYSINDGNGGADYTITNVYTAPGTITPLALTASLTGKVQKVYDGTTTATLDGTNYSLPGVIEGDDVSLNDPISGTYDNKNAGIGKVVTVTGLQISGDDANNYTVNGTAAGAVGIITPAALTLTAVTDTKTYDGGVSSSGTPTNSPLVKGDSLSNVVQTFGSKNVLGAGGSTLSVTGYTINDGNDGQNYTVTLVTAPGTINPAPLTIAAVTEEKTYDGTTVATVTPNPTGLVGGDTLVASEAFGSKNAGPATLAVAGYTISDGNNGGNYVVTTTTAAGTIDPKALTVTLVGSVSKPFDGNADATLTTSNYSLSGVITGDNASLNDPTSGQYDSPTAGTNKLITVTGLALSGDDAANYTVNGTAAGTIGTIVAPPQPFVITLPPTDVTTPDFEQAAAAIASGAQSNTTVVNVFPVQTLDPDQAGLGDSSPITGAGNRDLWTTSDESDKNCPPNTTCPSNGGTAP